MLLRLKFFLCVIVLFAWIAAFWADAANVAGEVVAAVGTELIDFPSFAQLFDKLFTVSDKGNHRVQ